jgi:ectoine hydroxylase-related dioxygenase (phytanoyl-CoA dioxygenase family)
MIIIEDFLPETYINELENTFLSSSFPWYYLPHTAKSSSKEYDVDVIDTDFTRDSHQFAHNFYTENTGSNSSYFELVKPIFWFIEQKIGAKCHHIFRAKVHTLIREPDFPDNFHNPAHTDVFSNDSDNLMILLYYVCDSDGDTFVFNESAKIGQVNTSVSVNHRVSPKKGRAVIMSAKQFHASSPPRSNSRRVAINFVFSGSGYQELMAKHNKNEPVRVYDIED